MHTWLMVMLRQRQRHCNTINSNQQYKHISYVFFCVLVVAIVAGGGGVVVVVDGFALVAFLFQFRLI